MDRQFGGVKLSTWQAFEPDVRAAPVGLKAEPDSAAINDQDGNGDPAIVGDDGLGQFSDVCK
jgi:hypothetical protein